MYEPGTHVIWADNPNVKGTILRKGEDKWGQTVYLIAYSSILVDEPDEDGAYWEHPDNFEPMFTEAELDSLADI